MELRIYRDPDKPNQECKAHTLLKRLIDQGQLKSYDPCSFGACGGECVEVATGILLDMADAGISTSGWLYVQAEWRDWHQGLHTWLEYDGWAIDFSGGWPIFAPASEFARLSKAKNMKRFTFKLLSPKGSVELEIFDQEMQEEERNKRHCPACDEELSEERHNCVADDTEWYEDPPKHKKPPKLNVKEHSIVGGHSDDPLMGQIIGGRYRIDERLGKGGMGVVYKAIHLLIDRPVAIKVLNADLAKHSAVIERFRREARFAGRMIHDNIVVVTDFGVEGIDNNSQPLPFIVMQLLEGESLRSKLLRVKRLPYEEVISTMLPIADALATAHNTSVCHRDVKPENIFIAKRPHMPDIPVLLDFGIVKQLDRTGDPLPEDVSKHNRVDHPFISTVGAEASTLEDENLPLYITPKQLIGETLTRTGAVVGTPLYMSPEQLEGHRVDHRTDIYSFSAVMYEMLSDSPPFEATTVNSFISKLLYHPPTPFSVELGIPLALANCVIRGLAKNRDKRQQSMREVITEMQSVVKGT